MWERVRRRANGRKHLTSFFFTHFADTIGEETLWQEFQWWGRVWEVFIPRKRDETGRRFGFVRFQDVTDVGRLERQLDNVFIADQKLHVNRPKFAKVSKEQVGSKEQLARRHIHQDRSREMPLKKIPELGRRKELSYAEVVRAQKPRKGWPKDDDIRVQTDKGKDKEVVRGNGKEVVGEKWKVKGLQVECNIDTWLSRSKVGKVKEVSSIQALQDAFLVAGFAALKVRYLGGDLVLISGLEDMDLDALLKDDMEWLKETFVSIEPWSPSSIPNSRICWLRCYGLPLNLWRKECFSFSLQTEYQLLLVDEDTVNFSRTEYARLQIRTNRWELLTCVKSITINGVDYLVRLIEETERKEGATCWCHSLQKEVEEGDSSC